MASLFKEGTLAYRERRHARKQQRHAEKRRADAKDEREARKVRDAVWVRDKGRDRAYGLTVWRFTEGDPKLEGHCHHKAFKSAGGPTTTANLVLLSALAHERAHARYDGIVLDIEGDCDGTLTFTERERETGEILRTWESPSP